VLPVTEHVHSFAVRGLAIAQKFEHSWNRVRLENLTVSHIIKNLHPFEESHSQDYAIRTRPDTQSATSHLRSVLILFVHQCIGLRYNII